MMLNYDAPLYRPPSEANSLIFQVTLGCSFNQCSFCDMYRSKEYSERTWDEVKGEIDMMAKIMPDTQRVFLADGDAINLSTEYMVKILKYIREKFSSIERISCYAMPMNLLKKTPEDLQELHDAGLNMLYLGIESGSDIVLRKVTKGATSKTIIKACNKAKDVGFKLSCMVILGLGGKKYSKENAIETGKVISASKPDFVGALTLYLENGIKDEFITKWGGEFVKIDDNESLEELELLVSNINAENQIVFRANHGSNAYNIAGTFPQDKDEMLEKIGWLNKHPENVRPEGLRGF
ncbi:radical SAM protein [Candidatus Nitrosopelagicus sp.]|nr:radical SAM protein [Candidatus Nitrosopelagicus sp.]MDC0169908.1 radical SAM protein [Candidatus Nitrosopelagicus sp.]MDC0202196.1 radical SAM protein [Candidatus Nitrosopelagicus sp.]MDC0211386.1 radical SAM protein [Candidatus Nitrosopelagicus sp.]